MKILHVLYSGLGGHGNVFFSMVDADDKNVFKYEAIFFGIEEVRNDYIQKAINKNIAWYFVKKNPGMDLKSYKKIFSIIKQSKADIIFLHSSAYIIPAIFAAFFLKGKRKIIVRETEPNHLKRIYEWAGLSMALPLADKTVFLSEEYKNDIEKKLKLLYRKKRIAVIPNGVDLTIFHPGNKLANGSITIGMQSRLSETKDHATLLRAFAVLKNQRYTNIKLKIAGDGVCKNDLILLSQELSIEKDVEFTGMLEENDLVKFLHDLTIYVHASLGETMSTAIMQAMACGLPIIASDVPGINNMIINNKTGILVPVKNEQVMADAIKYLVNTNSRAAELGANAFEFAKMHYSNVTMFKKYKELFTA